MPISFDRNVLTESFDQNLLAEFFLEPYLILGLRWAGLLGWAGLAWAGGC